MNPSSTFEVSQDLNVKAITLPRGMVVLPPKEFYSPSESGGIAASVRSTLCDNEVIIGPKPHGEAFYDTPFIPITCPKSPAIRRFIYGLKLIRILKKYQPTYVEIHNKARIAHMVRTVFPHLPIFLVLHNDPCHIRGLTSYRKRYKMAQSIHIVTKSHMLKRRYLAGHNTAKVTVIPNATDTDIDVCFNKKKKRILYVGRITQEKGADSFVRACKEVLSKHPDWEVMMIGADRYNLHHQETSFITQLKEEITHSPIIYRGLLPHQDVMEVLKRSAIAVVPSRGCEAFGLAALEAMINGASLLTSGNGALRDVAGNTALYADPDKLDVMIGQLNKLIEDPKLRHMLATKARARAKKLFNKDKVRKLRQRTIYHILCER